jgi:hypothetical protein
VKQGSQHIELQGNLGMMGNKEEVKYFLAALLYLEWIVIGLLPKQKVGEKGDPLALLPSCNKIFSLNAIERNM